MSIHTESKADRADGPVRWKLRGAYVVGALMAAGLSVAVTAQVIGAPAFTVQGENGEIDEVREPLSTDVSALVQPNAAFNPDTVTLQEHSNHGSFLTATGADKAITTVEAMPVAQRTGANIPTGMRPSPIAKFGLKEDEFSFPLLQFEEFGPEKLDARATPGMDPMPQPQNFARGPVGSDLEKFLAQPSIYPFPTQQSNTSEHSPWKGKIEEFLGKAPGSMETPIEGRPPGEGWGHQRWNEFYPQAYYKTAQAGARGNENFRAPKQLHKFAVGEFGPGGLYYREFTDPKTGKKVPGNGGIQVQFHSKLPIQHPNSVWTFDGTMPPKLLMARYGEPVLMRHYNALPIDPSANKGFGLHTITTHEHNGHNPAESDGVAQAFFFPGQFYDYRWPLQLAGYDSINTGATDPRAGHPCTPGETLWVNDARKGRKVCPSVTGINPTTGEMEYKGIIKIRGDWRETMSTHWFHDHMLDFTAQNVYKGNAVMMNYYSSLDRGFEGKTPADCHYADPVSTDPSKVPTQPNLCLPSGSNMAWGNRDYDINLVLGDKAWDQDGQMYFNVFNKNGFLGDRVLVNFVWHPTLDVRARRYRFRILPGSVSRYFSLALVQEFTGATGEIKGASGTNKSYTAVPFHMVANDGNLLQHAVAFDGKTDLDGNGNAAEHKGTLPQQAIAERYDIVVDFAKVKPGAKLFLVNLQEHQAPQITNKRIPLADVLSGKYVPASLKDDDGDGVADRWIGGDPGVGKIMQINVKACTLPGTVDAKGACVDNSMDPSLYTETVVDPKTKKVVAGRQMIPVKINRDDPLQHAAKLKNANHREFTFGHSGGTDEAPWTIKTDGGTGYSADTRRITAAPQLAHGPTGGGTIQNDAPYEVWYLQLQGGWDHPVHIHFEEGIILRRGGKAPPAWEKYARKDVYRIGPDLHAGDSVEIALQFREFSGTFVEHCHATQHEDNAMLMRWDLDRPGSTLAMPTPMPTWNGVEYTGSAALATYKTGGSKGTTYIPGK